MRTLEELPENARKYLERISELCNVQISIFSVGPDREQTNLLKNCGRTLYKSYTMIINT